MKLRAVSVSGLKQVMYRENLVETGIFKRPVDGPAACR